MNLINDPRTQTNAIAGMIAMTLMVLLGGVLYALFKVDAPENNHDVLLVVVGVLTGSVSTIVNFFFGSSSTTKQKDATIETLAKTAQVAGNALAPLAADQGTVVLKPGEQATIEPTPTGATINKES